MDLQEIHPGDFVMNDDNKRIVFARVETESPKESKVSCPECHLVMDKRSARRHYDRWHLKVNADHSASTVGKSSTNSDTSTSKRDSSSQKFDQPKNTKRVKENEPTDCQVSSRVDSDIHDGSSIGTCDEYSLIQPRISRDDLIEITAGLPLELVRSFLKSMNISPYQIESTQSEVPNFSIMASDPSAQQLLSALRPEYTLQKIALNDLHLIPPLVKDLSQDYDDLLVDEHLKVIEMGGVHGLERLVGSVIRTEGSCIEIHCIEIYSRFCLDDPHAESPSMSLSSAPNNAKTTQYPGRLKIAVLSDNYGNRRLIIGVRDYNYLVTAGKYNDKIIIGPSRCGVMTTDETARIFIRKVRQDPHALESSVLGLSQVRSYFGHPTTYKIRRAGLQGYSALPQMPVSVFTLSQWQVGQASVFYRLWQRSRKSKAGPILLLEDLDPQHENNTKPGKILRSLRDLFPECGTLHIASSTEAERLLCELASYFSTCISDKNKIIMKNSEII